MKLTEAARKKLPKKLFGLPNQRKFPLNDKNHAKNAKARASQMEHEDKLTAAEKKKIDAKANKVLGNNRKVKRKKP